MAKKKKPSNREILNVCDNILNTIPEDLLHKYEMLNALISMGVTPEEYEKFYNIAKMADSIINKAEDDVQDDAFAEWGDRGITSVKENQPLDNAENKTLHLRIQMKNVTKPPMWREVLVPANYNFMQLHDIIQEVTGLEDCHLWQFNKQAYRGGLCIGFSDEIDHITHEAEETALTRFLQNKGDKLEYVYDFGDDWIFTVEVKELIDKPSEHPVCLKFKSILNAIEDFGGPYMYDTARKHIDEWPALTKRQQKTIATDMGFDSPAEYIDFLLSNYFSIEDTNSYFQTI